MDISWTFIIGWMCVAYLIGAIPSGYLLVKVFLKQDVRAKGSGNIGATNVLRVGNARLALLTYIFDVVKIWVPMLLFSKVANPLNDIPADIMLLYLTIVGACGVIGHMYSCWLKFQGGKGVASIAGYFLWLFPVAGVVGMICFFVIVFVTRIVSIASLISVAIGYVCVMVYSFETLGFNLQLEGAAKIMLSLVVALVVWRHKDNIKRLIQGTENKLRF